jgi:hypothetical protein
MEIKIVSIEILMSSLFDAKFSFKNNDRGKSMHIKAFVTPPKQKIEEKKYKKHHTHLLKLLIVIKST